MHAKASKSGQTLGTTSKDLEVKIVSSRGGRGAADFFLVSRHAFY